MVESTWQEWANRWTRKNRGDHGRSVIARLQTAYSRKRACVRKKKSFWLSPPISNVYAKIERNVEHELPVNWPRTGHPFQTKIRRRIFLHFVTICGYIKIISWHSYLSIKLSETVLIVWFISDDYKWKILIGWYSKFLTQEKRL